MAVNEDMNLAFHDALNSEQPLTQVRELARRELQHGVSRREVLGQLESLRLELRGGEKPEDEDVVLDVMDFVSGWSSPHMKL